VAPEVVKYGGIGWGIGIATNFDVGGARVNNATVVNNIIRVDDTTTNVGISFVLEAHYFLRETFLPFGDPRSCTETDRRNGSFINCTELAHGPFVAIEVGGGSSAAPAATGPITGYAMGWMVGMRHPNLPLTTASWNLGVGLRVTPNGKVLGDGLVANQVLPTGDALRYKNEPRYGLMLMSTFSF